MYPVLLAPTRYGVCIEAMVEKLYNSSAGVGCWTLYPLKEARGMAGCIFLETDSQGRQNFTGSVGDVVTLETCTELKSKLFSPAGAVTSRGCSVATVLARLSAQLGWKTCCGRLS